MLIRPSAQSRGSKDLPKLCELMAKRPGQVYYGMPQERARGGGSLACCKLLIRRAKAAGHAHQNPRHTLRVEPYP